MAWASQEIVNPSSTTNPSLATLTTLPLLLRQRAKQRRSTVIDNINHPKHYTSHPSGVECIQITEHMSFNLGNAIKYLWRADEKGAPLDDLKKAVWYIQREIAKREKATA